ncbi:MAG: hypothetical protein GH149_04395 [Methanosarcinales archaeon]|nr:hypothetical protein [Methanosarcinales archaeon]
MPCTENRYYKCLYQRYPGWYGQEVAGKNSRSPHGTYNKGVEYGDYKGEFTSFERRGEDIPQKATLDDVLGVLKSFDSKAERLVSILSGMDVTLKSVKEDTSSIKQDTRMIPGIKENTEKMLEKQEDTIGEISALREDLKSYMENKFAKIEYEIAEIKAKIGMV